MKTIKIWLRRFLDVDGPITRAEKEHEQWNKQIEVERQIRALTSEVREAVKFIGALYEYLEVRPRRTFVQDYSRLPAEEFPTTEVIKAEVVKRSASLRAPKKKTK